VEVKMPEKRCCLTPEKNKFYKKFTDVTTLHLLELRLKLADFLRIAWPIHL
jgi:hypothetical protein